MSALQNLINKSIDEKMKNLHCAFIAKILSVSGNKARIQPLGLTKQYGGTAQKQAVISGVHIARSALYKFTTTNIDNKTVAVPEKISVGDIVLCVCCDRNIDAALKGKNELPPVGFHNKSDCVIVSII